MRVQRLDRKIEIYPGKNLGGNGFQGAEVLFILRSDMAAITFGVLTDWLPKELQESSRIIQSMGIRPRALDLTLHFAVPTLTAEQNKHPNCPYLQAGSICHSMTESLQSREQLRDVLLAKGTAGLWLEMERRYYEAARIMQIPTQIKKVQL